MAAHEEIRYRLQRKLTELVGEEEAAALMASLPPVAWTDLATKDDLAHVRELLEAHIDSRADRLETRLTRQITKQTRAYLLWNAAMLLTVAGMAFSAAGLGA